MEHPFLTHRAPLALAETGLRLIEDMRTIAAASPEDLLCIAQRRDVRIADPDVFKAVSRNACTIGTMVDDVAAACAAVDVAVPEGFASLSSKWIECVTGKEGCDGLALASTTEPMVETLKATLAKHQSFEVDGGSSTPSDYSDSETDSSSTESRSDDEDEEESESE